jgi:hypothetical protein
MTSVHLLSPYYVLETLPITLHLLSHYNCTYTWLSLLYKVSITSESLSNDWPYLSPASNKGRLRQQDLFSQEVWLLW